MYIHSVKLINFKSIGNYPEAEIILEPRITAIIGKNESGKSNILDGLSRINFIKNNPSAFSESIINRNSPSNTTNKYVIILKPLVEEIEKGLVADTKVEIDKEHCIVTGGFLDYCKQNVRSYFAPVVNILNEIGNNPFQLNDQDLAKYKKYKKELEQIEYLDIYCRTLALNFLHLRVNKIASEYKGKLNGALETVQEIWQQLLCMFPTFFYRISDKHLETSYKIDEIEKEVNNATVAPNSLLHDFVKLIEVSPDDFILACQKGTLPKQETLRKKNK